MLMHELMMDDEDVINMVPATKDEGSTAPIL